MRYKNRAYFGPVFFTRQPTLPLINDLSRVIGPSFFSLSDFPPALFSVVTLLVKNFILT